MAVLTRLFGLKRLTWLTGAVLASKNSPGGYDAHHPVRTLNSYALNGRLI